MIKALILGLGVVGLFCFPLQEIEKLSYAERSALVWSDFKGTPDEASRFMANAKTGIRYNWTYATDKQRLDLTYEVAAYFYPLESWVKSEVKTDSSMLAHEQLHFDITELHARKLRKALREYVLRRNIRRDINRMYARVEQEQRQMQQRYDTETAHHLDTIAQKRWKRMVADSLLHYQAYLE